MSNLILKLIIGIVIFVIIYPDLKKDFLETVKRMGFIILFALFIVNFAFQFNIVDGVSMENTLYSGELSIINKVVYRFNKPERNEIVVIRPKINPNKKYIKRVIGISGDEIEIKNGYLFVNREKVKEKHIPEKIEGNFGPYQVPSGNIFVLGDNRNNSLDSRNKEYVGMVDSNRIEGRVSHILFPFTRIRKIN